MTTDSEVLDIVKQHTHWETRELSPIASLRVLVVTKPMTKEESRKVFLERPVSKYSESHFGGDDHYDDVCFIANRLAKFCKLCGAPTRNSCLGQDGLCPECLELIKQCRNQLTE